MSWTPWQIIAGGAQVSVSGSGIPSDLVSFLDGLGKLVPADSASPVQRLDLRVVDDDDAFRAARARAERAGSPSHPMLRDLPSTARATVLQEGDVVLLDWTDAGILVATLGSGEAEIVLAPNRRHLGWMLGHLVAAVLSGVGALRTLHASGVRFEGQDLLLSGRSGSGKTTLGLMLLAEGASALTEDITYIGPSGAIIARPLRDYMNVRQGTLHALHRHGFIPQGLRDESDPSREDSLELFARGKSGEQELEVREFVRDDGPTTARPALLLLPRISVGPATGLSSASTDEVVRATAVPPVMISWVLHLMSGPLRELQILEPPLPPAVILPYSIHDSVPAVISRVREAVAQLPDRVGGRRDSH